MGILKTVFLEPANLFGMADRLWKPTVLPLIKYYATYNKQPDDVKKEKKLAKKLAVFAEQPQYTQHRSNKWTELKKKYDQEVAAKGQEIIKVRLLDGKIIEGFSWELTPLDVAKQISHSLASEVYIAKIDNVLWDLERPLESDCGIQLFKFDSPDAKAAYWTTAACTLAEALERLYCMDNSSVVCNVGSTQTGFFADIHSKQKSINKKEFAAIEESISKILTAQRVNVERIVTTKNDVNELFAYNPFKIKIISERPGDRLPIYRCGSFIEISDTPLARHNKKVNVVKLVKIESVISNGESVQRIHGVAFPTMKELRDFLKQNQMA